MINNSNSFLIEKKLKYLQDRKSNSSTRWNITWFLGTFLSNLVSIKNPKNILEVGTSNGFSTLWLAKGALSSKIYTIEVDKDRFNEAKSNFESCKLENITQLNGEFFEILDTYEFNCKFDFIFLDAGHQFYKDIILKLESANLLEEDVMFVCDNVLTHGHMKDFISFMAEKFEISDLIEADSGFLISTSFKK